MVFSCFEVVFSVVYASVVDELDGLFTESAHSPSCGKGFIADLFPPPEFLRDLVDDVFQHFLYFLGWRDQGCGGGIVPEPFSVDGVNVTFELHELVRWVL